MADFPSTTSAYGRWGLMDVRDAIMGGNWPSPPAQDPYFEYVSMLLPGNGTNGAQNNTFLDSSTNNFTITRNGNTTQGSFSPYGSNWSNYFDGSGDYLSTPSSITLGSGDLTIEGWAYPTNTTGSVWYDFRGPDSGSAGNNPVIQWSTVTASKFTVRIDGTNAITSSSTFSTNTWHHVALVRSGTTVTLYVNGTSQGTYTTSTNFAQAYVRIGAYGGDGSLTFTGYASNLRAVIGTAVYTSTFAPPTEPLTAITNTSLLTCQSNRFIDNSTNAYAITVTGNPSVQRFSPFSPTASYSTSVIGGSGYFDGTGDYLSAANNTNIDVGTGAFTIEAWVYRQGGDADWRVMGGSVNGSGFFGGRSGKLGLGRSNVAWDLESSTNVYNDNAWTHIVYVRDGSGNLSIFANGVRVANTTGNSNNYGLNSGSLQVAAEQGGQTWIGYMSNFRLVKGSAVYDPTSTTLTVPTAPLTAVSGTGLLLAYINGAIFDNAMMNNLETVGNAQISTSVVKYGTGSLKFDGTGDWLACTAIPNLILGSGDFTIECWVYISSYTNYGIFCGQWNTTATQAWAFRQDSTTGKLSFVFNPGEITVTSSGAIGTGAWAHIAVTRSGSTFRLFINGTLDGSTTSSATITSTSNYFSVGGTGGVNPDAMNGYIDDLRITKGYARYTSNFTAPTEAFPTF